MPFTPFHFGFGLTAAMLSRHVDFWAFAVANVIIDIEPGWNIWRNSYPAHRFFHTPAGATILIVPAVLVTLAATRGATRLGILRAASRVGPTVIGATFGAWSHVLLDAITHGGATPAAPLTRQNPLYDIIEESTLYRICVAAIVVGVALAVWRLRAARQQRAAAVPPAA